MKPGTYSDVIRYAVEAQGEGEMVWYTLSTVSPVSRRDERSATAARRSADRLQQGWMQVETFRGHKFRVVER